MIDPMRLGANVADRPETERRRLGLVAAKLIFGHSSLTGVRGNASVALRERMPEEQSSGGARLEIEQVRHFG